MSIDQEDLLANDEPLRRSAKSREAALITSAFSQQANITSLPKKTSLPNDEQRHQFLRFDRKRLKNESRTRLIDAA